MDWNRWGLVAGRLISLLLLLGLAVSLSAQPAGDQPLFDSETLYRVSTCAGGEFVGRIIAENPREITIATESLGEVVVPKYVIRSIVEAEPGFIAAGDGIVADEVFSTRYLFTTNALPLEAGSHYFNLSPIGPDIQFAVARNLGLGLLSSWAGFPLVFSAKYAFPIPGIVRFGAGLLLGSGTYFDPDFAVTLPYGVATVGNRRYNLTLSGGYGYLLNGELGNLDRDVLSSGGSAILSLSGMAKLVRNLTLLWDTFLLPTEEVAILAVPLVRWQNKTDRAWQVGFAGVLVEGEYSPPIPVIQWYRKIE